MVQGEFTKEEALETREAFREVFAALSKKNRMDFIGHANDIDLFLSAAEIAAPNQKLEGEEE